jgi:hypothetical protein
MGFSCCQQRVNDEEILSPITSCPFAFNPSPYPYHATGRSSHEAQILSAPGILPHSGAELFEPAPSGHWQETF